MELNPRDKDHPVLTIEDRQKGCQKAGQKAGHATNSRREKR
jgi:hypothetical protein